MSRSTRVRSLVQAEVAADGERLLLDLGLMLDLGLELDLRVGLDLGVGLDLRRSRRSCASRLAGRALAFQLAMRAGRAGGAVVCLLYTSDAAIYSV